MKDLTKVSGVRFMKTKQKSSVKGSPYWSLVKVYRIQRELPARHFGGSIAKGCDLRRFTRHTAGASVLLPSYKHGTRASHN